MNQRLIEKAFFNYVEESLFDSLSEFYKYFTEEPKKEASAAKKMDKVLHLVKDKITDSFRVLGMCNLLDVICRCIDCTDFEVKEELFEIVFQSIKDIYYEVGKSGTERHHLCLQNLKRNWRSFSGLILYHAEKQLNTHSQYT